MPFTDAAISAQLMRGVSQFTAATSIQSAAIPIALAGGDLLAISPTGSGKTIAFVLPLLQRWIDSSKRKPSRIHTLILVPTRELAAQVRGVVLEFSKHLPERPKVVSAIGGVSINPQMMALRGGADFLVATPGRLLDLLDKNALNLTDTAALVIDEADRMLDLGFSAEITRILSLLPAHRQNLFFSATFPKPVAALALKILHDPARLDLTQKPLDTPSIHQRAIRTDKKNRTPLLRHLITAEGWQRVLIFVASQYTADHVAEKLRRLGIPAAPFHGGISQGGRTGALDDFQNSITQVLVSTDLAARGLDILGLPVVVNYDLPRSATDYTHRMGRTGRAGERGMVVSFVTEESAKKFSEIEKRQHQQLPREEVSGFEPLKTLPPSAPGSGGIKGRRKSKKDKLREGAKN